MSRTGRLAGEHSAGPPRAGRLLLQAICKRQYSIADHCKKHENNERAMDQQCAASCAKGRFAGRRRAGRGGARLLLQAICKRRHSIAAHCKLRRSNERAMDQQSAECRGWGQHAGSHHGRSGRSLAGRLLLQRICKRWRPPQARASASRVGKGGPSVSIGALCQFRRAHAFPPRFALSAWARRGGLRAEPMISRPPLPTLRTTRRRPRCCGSWR